MATNWFVIQIEGADDGIVKLLPSPDAAQEYITARIADGVPPDRLRLFNADDTPFGVAYQPIVTIGAEGPKTPIPGPAPTAAPTNGTPAADEPTPADAREPAGTKDGVTLSSMFNPD